MAQQAAVTLNTVVYSPSGSENGIVKWFNRVGGVLNSFSALTQRFVTGAGGQKLTKVTYRLEVPVVATTDTDCSCAGTLLRTSSCQVDFWLAADSTVAERTDLYLRIKDLIATSTVSNAVENLDPAYA